MTLPSRLHRALAAAALATLSAATAADDGPRTPLLPAYVQECGSCHVAFPPGLLPAASWQRLMGGLGRHFGSDASLDAASTQQLAAWLQANAGSGKRAAAPPKDDRITQGAWFQREHREVAARFGTPAVNGAVNGAVKGASDCAACHTRAVDGSYREREIRVPR